MPIIPEREELFQEGTVPATPPSEDPYSLSRFAQGVADTNEDAVFRLQQEVSRKRTPEQAARILKIQMRTGMNEDLIAETLDTEDLNAIEEDATKPDFDPVEFRKRNPRLHKLLSSSPNYMAVVRKGKDFKTLQDLEQVFYRKDDPFRPLSDEEVERMAKRSVSRKMKDRERMRAVYGTETIDSESFQASEKELFEQELEAIQKEEATLARIGKAGFGEKLDFDIPVASFLEDAAQKTELYFAAKRITEGKEEEDDRDLVMRFARLEEAAQRRGTSVGGLFASIVSAAPAVMTEFALTGGTATVAKEGTEKLLQTAFKKVLKGRIGELITKGTGTTVGALARTPLVGAGQIIGGGFERMTPLAQLTTDEQGHIGVALDPSTADGALEAFTKSFGSAFIQTLSESAGAGAEKLVGSLKRAVFTRWLRLHPNEGVTGFLTALNKKTGWNGIVGEVFEERVAEFGEAAAGITPYTRPTLEQIAAEVVGFGIIGVPGTVARLGTSRRAPPPPLSQPQAFKDMGKLATELSISKESPEVAQEMVKAVVGEEKVLLSAKAHETYWQSQKDEEGKPIDPEEVAEELGITKEAYREAIRLGHDLVIPGELYFKYIANTEHNQLFVKEGKFSPLEVTPSELKEEEKREKPKAKTEKAPAEKGAVQKVGEKVAGVLKFLGLGNIPGLKGVTPQNIDQMAGVFAESYKQRGALLGVEPAELFERERVQVGLSEEAAPGAQAFEQPVFHGSQTAFERFDLSKVGTGTGQQAFGYGAYFSNKKDVAAAYKGAGGRLFKADIPEDTDYLDWDKPISQQSEGVQKALQTLGLEAKKYTRESFPDHLEVGGATISRAGEGFEIRVGGTATRATWEEVAPLLEAPQRGEKIYRDLVAKEGSERAASETLAAAGLAGIAYTDSGARNYVVFDDSLIKVLEFEQKNKEGGRRGFTQSFEDRIRIAFTKQADFSTWLHEVGHVWLIQLGRDFETLKARDSGSLNPAQKAFLERSEGLLEWLGAKSFKSITREQHEKFAEAVETYFAKGQTPSSALKRAFHTFKRWMLDIYGKLRGQVQLDPRVTTVLDRLLASEEEIAAARARQGVEGLFEDPAAVGMTEKEAEKYAKVLENAQRASEERIGEKALAAVVRERETWWKEESARVRKDVEKEVNAQRDYAAAEFLRSGNRPDGTHVGELKLSREALEDQYTKPTAQGIPKDMTTDGPGATADQAAEILTDLGYPFSSGSELIHVLGNLRDKNEVIDQLTQERMKATYGDIMEDASELLGEVMKAIHTPESAAQMRFEAQWLFSEEFAKAKGLVKALTRPVKSVEEYAKAAREYIKTLSDKQIDPRVYQRAEQRAGREALDAFLKGNWEEAGFAKIRQLENHEMYRAAVEAKEGISDAAKFMRKFERPLKRQQLGKAGADYLEQIDSIMERFSFKRASERTQAKRDSLREWVEKQKEKGIEPVVPEKLLNEAYKQNFSDIPYGELLEIRDTVKNIDHLATVKNTLLAAKAKREFDAGRNAGVESIMKNSTGVRPRDAETRRPQVELLRGGASVLAMHRKLANLALQMDGWKNGGPLWDLFIRPMNEAGDTEALDNMEAAEKLSQIFSAYNFIEMTEMRWTRLFIQQLGISLSKQGRLMIALNSGNQDSLEKLKAGLEVTYKRSFSDADIQAIRDTLDEKDWDFVKDIWRLIDSYWPRVKALAQEVDGIAPEKVEGIPIQTRFGVVQGGYFPLKYDDRQPGGGYQIDAKEAAERAMRGASLRSTTKHGHREERVKGVRRPIRLDFDVIFTHLSEVVHDLSHYKFLIDANRLLRDSKMEEAIKDHYGDIVYTEFEKSLQDIAAGGIHAKDALEQAMNWMRRGTQTSVLAFKFSTALVQPLGITQSGVKIGWKWVARGLSRWMGDASRMENTVRWVHEKSSFMKTRHRTQIREISEIRNQLRLTGKGWTKYQSAAMWMTAKAQQLVDIPTWIGAYEKAMDGIKPETGQTSQEVEARAVALADQAVIDSQGGGQIKDLARVQRLNAWAKLFTLFSNYYITRWNLTREVIGHTKPTVSSVLKMAIDLMLLYPIPTALAFFAKDLIRGDDDDDDEKKLKRLTRDILSDPFNNFMVVREAVPYMQGYGHSYRGPAGLRPLTRGAEFLFVQLPQAVEEGETDEAFWRSLNESGGTWLHLWPSSQIDATVRGFNAFLEDEAGPGAVLLGPGPKR